MACEEIVQNQTYTIKANGFRDTHAAAGVFLNAATTAEALIFDIRANPEVQIGGAIPLIFQAGDVGNYWGDIAHDFASNGLVKGMGIAIRPVLEEGVVHWEPEELVLTVK